MIRHNYYQYFVSLLTLFLTFWSCQSQPSIADLNNEKIDINGLYNSFIITKDYAYLDSIYKQLNNVHLDKTNCEAIIGSFMYMKKYSELDSVLTHFDPSDSNLLVKKEIAHNIVRHLNRSNPFDNHYIESNINSISERIEANKNDSLAYVDLFINLIYIKGKENTLNDIDTLQLYNKNISDFFYENYLREIVREYPKEFYALKTPNVKSVAIPLTNSNQGGTSLESAK